MLKKRIIARLDIKGPNLVKGVNLEGLRVLGNPSEFAKYYYETGADEILLMDCVASLYGRNSLDDIISNAAKNTFIPITVGGGIRNLNDINRILRSGADKVCINTAAINNPKFIKEAVEHFGSSTIVCAIEVIMSEANKYLCYTDNGREHTGLEMNYWMKKVQDLGVGEILLTSVDKEGTGEGFDISLVNSLDGEIEIPIIYHGGIGKMEDVLSLMKEHSFDGVALASTIHYHYINHHDSSPSDLEGNTNFIQQKRSFSGIKPFAINSLKELLSKEKLAIRLI